MVSANSAAATMPGASAGNVTRRKARHSVAPKSMAASSGAGSRVRNRAETTMATYAMENETCARITVYKPSCHCSQRNAHWKRASSETPVTISGVTSDRYSEPESSRDRRFQSAYAASVPAIVEIAVETIATTTLVQAASAISGSVNTIRYQRSENPSHNVKRDALKLKTINV